MKLNVVLTVIIPLDKKIRIKMTISAVIKMMTEIATTLLATTKTAPSTTLSMPTSRRQILLMLMVTPMTTNPMIINDIVNC